MIELHLIGYTSDLRYLVLDLDPEGERGRYRLVVDGDLLLTLDELRDLRAQAGMDVGIPYERLEERLGIVLERGGSAPAGSARPEIAEVRPPEPVDDPERPVETVTARPPTSQPPPAPEIDAGPPPAFRLIEAPPEPEAERRGVDDAREGEHEEARGAEQVRGPAPREAPEALEGAEAPEDAGGPAEVGEPQEPGRTDGSDELEEPDGPDEPDEPDEPEEAEQPPEREGRGVGASAPAAPPTSGPDVPTPGRDSDLSPAQIQARLRAGRRPGSVAEEAGTDVAWVERWLAPILTERAQVLQEAQAMHLERPRKGRSGAPLGAAVAANLRRRHLDPQEDADWSVKRRANGRWSINVRYRYRKKTRSATWALDREEGELTPSSDAARDLGWTDSA